ncbi:MAG: pyridoxal-dependent decarboxylase [Thermomicrobiales bacterium]
MTFERNEPFDAETFRALGYRAVDIATNHLARMPASKVYQQVPSELRSLLMDRRLPDAGTPVSALLDDFEQNIKPYPMGNGHQRFFGWVNSPPDPAGILAELLAASLDPSCAGGDHAAIYLERGVVRWLMDLVQFPTEGSMGILTSGGSMASLTAIATARHAASVKDGWNDREQGLQDGHKPLVMYLSGEGHTTMIKAAELLGIGSSYVRKIPVDSAFRMDVGALGDAVEADRAAGLRPFLVAASAGTVGTGAIDPLDEIADFCRDAQLWFHIDGAYGAVGVLDQRLASKFSGMSRADSLALDPHKWLSVPVECGCAMIRDASLLRDTFSLVPPYVRTEEGKGFGGLPWFSEYGFQQTRGFRALKVWMTLAAAGADGLRATISRHNDLARYLADLVRKDPNFELLADPTLSIVCFRYVPAEAVAANAMNQRIMEHVQASGTTFVTQTMIDGTFWLRACILHFATTESDLDALIRNISSAANMIEADSSLPPQD